MIIFVSERYGRLIDKLYARLDGIYPGLSGAVQDALTIGMFAGVLYIAVVHYVFGITLSV